MINKYKIGIFKDREDIEFIFTNDDIINITGMMGSGKTTLAKKVANITKKELIIFDWMFGRSLGNRPTKIANLLKKFEKEYPETACQKIFKNNKNRDDEIQIQKYAPIVYNFVVENIKLPMIIEGQHLYKWMDYDILRGKLIIKRSSLFNSYLRAFKRDVSRLYKQYKKHEVSGKDVLNKIQERILLPIKDYFKINKFIEKLLEEKQYGKY